MQVGVSAFIINLLGLALPIFVMNVYDKVIPNAAFVTLWTLATGIGIAIALDLALRGLRGRILQEVGEVLDTRIARTLFTHALSLRPQGRGAGAPVLVNQIRDFETVRDFFGSASFVAMIDFAFVALFIWVLAIIVGPLAYVPLAAVPLVLGLALLAQLPLTRIASDAQETAGQRQSVLTEAFVGHETIKTLNAEPALQRGWDQVSARHARISGRGRFWSGLAVSGTQMVQQAASVILIVWGVYLVSNGQITVGALIAANILAGRALAPLGAIAQTLFRAQYARRALRALTVLMNTPPEAGPDVVTGTVVTRAALRLEAVSFTYPDAPRPAIDDLSLTVAPGESIAILGRVGSGKSTLGRLISGLLAPDSGNLLIDGRAVAQYDPSALRDGIGYLPQDPDLFTGTLHDNLIMGRPEASLAEIEAALEDSAMRAIVEADPAGLARQVGEKGANLSGGQRQGLALARLLIRRPKLLFLDEPTNAMDQEMETAIAERLSRLNAAGTGLILCTHRPALARIAKRWIVMEAGRIMLDGTQDAVAGRLQSAPPPPRAAE